MKTKKKNKENKLFEPVILEPFEVKIEDVGGSVSKLIRKFNKKVRKEEILKPYYGRLMHFTSKSQKKRQKKLRAIFEQRKKQLKELEEDG